MSDINPQKPALTIDLIAPEGNVFALVGKAFRVLEQAGQVKQSEALGNWFSAAGRQGAGVTYDDVRRMVEQYCDVTWLNEHPPGEAQLE